MQGFLGCLLIVSLLGMGMCMGVCATENELEQRKAQAEMAKPMSTPPPTPQAATPKPKPANAWIAKPYTVVKDEDISSGGRNRRRLRIVSQKASTPESQIATLMQAAIEVQRKEHSQFIAAWLLPFETATGAMTMINYAPDGCGVSGKDCTGEMWTDARVPLGVLTPEQIAVGKDWEKHEDRFKDADGLPDDGRLYKFLARQRNTDVDSLRSMVRGFFDNTRPSESIELPYGLRGRGELTPKEQAQTDDAACRTDLQCWGDKHNLRATRPCQLAVESLALYDYEWTDGWLEAKFDQFAWKDRKEGILAYHGSQIKFQNGFGAWMRKSYWCDYDPDTETALEARVSSP